MKTVAIPDALTGAWIDDYRFRVKGDLRYEWGDNQLEIPCGFETDFASTPRALHMAVILVGAAWATYISSWPLLWIALLLGVIVRRLVPPPAGRHARGALLHDYLYATGRLPKVQSDALFYWVMLECGVAPWRARMMLVVVLVFGWGPWTICRIRSLSKDN